LLVNKHLFLHFSPAAFSKKVGTVFSHVEMLFLLMLVKMFLALKRPTIEMLKLLFCSILSTNASSSLQQYGAGIVAFSVSNFSAHSLLGTGYDCRLANLAFSPVAKKQSQ